MREKTVGSVIWWCPRDWEVSGALRLDQSWVAELTESDEMFADTIKRQIPRPIRCYPQNPRTRENVHLSSPGYFASSGFDERDDGRFNSTTFIFCAAARLHRDRGEPLKIRDFPDTRKYRTLIEVAPIRAL